MNTKKGFTLIELLVVIAIIGILSSVVLASLNTARKKARDAKRISDVKNLQLALELYFDSNASEYPDSLAALATGGFVPNEPYDPIGTTVSYSYDNLTSAGAACVTATGDCLTYHLGADLENSGNAVLDTDVDRCATAATGCDSSAYYAGTTLQGEDTDGCGGTASRYCYDITP